MEPSSHASARTQPRHITCLHGMMQAHRCDQPGPHTWMSACDLMANQMHHRSFDTSEQLHVSMDKIRFAPLVEPPSLILIWLRAPQQTRAALTVMTPDLVLLSARRLPKRTWRAALVWRFWRTRCRLCCIVCSSRCPQQARLRPLEKPVAFIARLRRFSRPSAIVQTHVEVPTQQMRWIAVALAPTRRVLHTGPVAAR